MRRDVIAALALTLSLSTSRAWAQDASAPTDAAAVAEDAAPGSVDPHAALPPGHPPAAQGDPHGGGETLHRAQIAESFARESSELPAGVVVVRVVDGRGEPVPEVMVRVGAMREGEAVGAQEVRTGLDGAARIERMASDGTVAYRLSTDYHGARFGAPPFQLSPSAGYEVQIVRHEVTNTPRAILVWDARAEVRFKDDRVVVVMRVKLVNLTGMALGDTTPMPVTFVPSGGLQFPLPQGYTAFTAAPSMSDQRLTEEGGAVVFRGSIPPTTNEPVEVVYQYQMKLHGGDVELHNPLPLPVVNAMVVSEAPPGLTLTVEGMPPAESRMSEEARVLVTALERRPDDAPLRDLHLRLGGIPAAAGPSRLVASGAAGLLVLAALAYMVSQRDRRAAKRSRAAAVEERDRVLEEMRELTRLRASGEVGPQTYARRRRELATWLASVLKELDDAAPAESPYRAAQKA